MTGIIILAAGASTRLGSPKQNLVYEGESLLQRNIKTAVATGWPVTVVLGANAELIGPTISRFPINIIYNDEWQEGIASSIRLGIAETKRTIPQINGVILMLCDQPFVSTQLLLQLIPADATKNICACAYKGTIGSPAYFDNIYFQELQQLKGDEGAKKLILKYAGDVTTIPFALGAVDIDTREDFDRLNDPAE